MTGRSSGQMSPLSQSWDHRAVEVFVSFKISKSFILTLFELLSTVTCRDVLIQGRLMINSFDKMPSICRLLISSQRGFTSLNTVNPDFLLFWSRIGWLFWGSGLLIRLDPPFWCIKYLRLPLLLVYWLEIVWIIFFVLITDFDGKLFCRVV